jgi:hypothetical protein
MLVATFDEGEEADPTAMTYRREAAPQTPPSPPSPVPNPYPTPVPNPYPTPNPYPAPVPPPPTPFVSLDGVWLTIVNGQQQYMQIQGNYYQASANGMITEAGNFQVQNGMIFGQMTNGMMFQHYFTMGQDGRSFTITAANGYSMTYHRVQ